LILPNTRILGLAEAARRCTLEQWSNHAQERSRMPANSPEEIHSLMADAFNRGDLDAFVDAHEERAVTIVPPTGARATGRREIRVAPVRAHPRRDGLGRRRRPAQSPCDPGRPRRRAGRRRQFVAGMRVIGPRVLAPATIAVVGFGVWLVLDSSAWDFGQLWIQLGSWSTRRPS
jgi:hypothetical protein